MQCFEKVNNYLNEIFAVFLPNSQAKMVIVEDRKKDGTV